MCLPSTATKQTLIAQALPTESGNAAAALAHQAGRQATANQVGRMHRAFEQIRQDNLRRQETAQERFIVPPGTGEPNLVFNLAAVIRQRDRGVGEFVPKVETGDQSYGLVSIDAVSAVVRAAFVGQEITKQSDDVVRILMGALLLALSVAHEPVARRRAEAPGEWTRDVGVPPPWEATYPVLLDPIMWMVGTAFSLP